MAGIGHGLQQSLSLLAVTLVTQETGERDLGDRRPVLVADVDSCPIGVRRGIGPAVLDQSVSQQSGRTRQLIGPAGGERCFQQGLAPTPSA